MSDSPEVPLTGEALLRFSMSQLQEGVTDKESEDGHFFEPQPRDAREMPHDPPDPGGIQEGLAAFLKRTGKSGWFGNQSEAAKLAEYQAVQAAASSDPVAAILYLLKESADYIERFEASAYQDFWKPAEVVPMLLTPLVRKKQNLSPQQMDIVLDLLCFVAPCQTNTFPWAHFAKQIEYYTAAHEPSQIQWNAIADIAVNIDCRGAGKIRTRLETLIEAHLNKNAEDTDLPPLSFKTQEPWIERLQEEVRADCGGETQIDADRWRSWKRLVDHAATATSAKPSKRWLKTMGECVAEIGSHQVAVALSHVLSCVGLPAPEAPLRVYEDYEYSETLDATIPHDIHSELLRGLCWSIGVCRDDRLIQAVGKCGEVCYAKIRNYGPRAPKIGNACVVGLSESGSPLAVAQLSRMNDSVRHASSKKQIGKALDRAAEAAGLTREDLEEVAVPDCGFTSLGRLEVPLGDFTAVVIVNRRFKSELSWKKPDGQSQKSVPKTVKEGYADQLKELKATIKTVDQVLSTWRSRIENFPLSRREHSFETFTQRFVHHPLLGVLARRIIWCVTDDSSVRVGLATRDGFVDVDGKTHEMSQKATVRIWHPIDANADEVLAWRERLAQEEITQPFKQAHREVYLLTDAERTTRTYSNRFASHIVKQHQFKALCDERDWQYAIQGGWDSDGGIPTRQLEPWEMRAEFWIEPASNDTGDTGTWLHMSTDQVRFYAADTNTPMQVQDVPELAFSEIMRDVDLFVGVAGIGADPTWEDRGQEGFGRYWQGVSFGELSQSGETRRDVLRMLIPRLKIADRCQVEDRFLIVRGTKRTYKIHLGSGNILMEPNDQYLCIVADRSSKADNVALPFEGDRTLSLILSKAFLLAEDHKIKDPTILGQIEQ
jgi:hypothetical protein